MAVGEKMLRVVKPKTKRAKRALDKRAPKLKENVKKALLLHGTTSSAVVKEVISDLHHLKKAGGNAVLWTRKNENIRPFEPAGEAPLEFFSQKTDCSLFVFGSHSKKRPHNLVFGRMFDHHIYDMIEVGVEQYKSIVSLAVAAKKEEQSSKKRRPPQEGSKPCFAFIGASFESDDRFKQFKELILDFFRGEEIEAINIAGLDRVFICVAATDKVLLRHCSIQLKKSGTRVPRIELVDFGPSLDLVLRRHRLPSEDLRKEAVRSAPKGTKHKVKNVSSDPLQGKVGRIYMPKQEVGDMALKKMKGVKRERREAAAAAAAADGNDSSKKQKQLEGSEAARLEM